jgi:photosystem II stability/assembly factor-like uncharacterized protein
LASALFAGSGTGGAGGVYRSSDEGSTWTGFGADQSILPAVNAVAPDPTDASKVYVGTDAGAYATSKKQDGTLKWVTNGALADRRVFALVVDPASASTLLAGTDAGLYQSVDAGLTWAAVSGLQATAIYVLLFDPESPSTVYAGTDSGVFRSLDRGSSWKATNPGLTDLAVDALSVASAAPPSLYAGTLGGSVFRFGVELTQRLPAVRVRRTVHPRETPPRP